MFANGLTEDQGQHNCKVFKEGLAMKRLLALIIVLTLLVITGTLVSADGQTRRHRSKALRQAVNVPRRSVQVQRVLISIN